MVRETERDVVDFTHRVAFDVICYDHVVRRVGAAAAAMAAAHGSAGPVEDNNGCNVPQLLSDGGNSTDKGIDFSPSPTNDSYLDEEQRQSNEGAIPLATPWTFWLDK